MKEGCEMKPQSKIDVLISRAKTITDADPTAKSLNTLGSALFVVCVVLGIAALIFGIGFFAVSVVDTLKPEQTSIIVLISCVVGAVLLIVFGYILKLVIKALPMWCSITVKQQLLLGYRPRQVFTS